MVAGKKAGRGSNNFGALRGKKEEPLFQVLRTDCQFSTETILSPWKRAVWFHAIFHHPEHSPSFLHTTPISATTSSCRMDLLALIRQNELRDPRSFADVLLTIDVVGLR